MFAHVSGCDSRERYANQRQFNSGLIGAFYRGQAPLDDVRLAAQRTRELRLAVRHPALHAGCEEFWAGIRDKPKVRLLLTALDACGGSARSGELATRLGWSVSRVVGNANMAAQADLILQDRAEPRPRVWEITPEGLLTIRGPLSPGAC